MGSKKWKAFSCRNPRSSRGSGPLNCLPYGNPLLQLPSSWLFGLGSSPSHQSNPTTRFPDSWHPQNEREAPQNVSVLGVPTKHLTFRHWFKELNGLRFLCLIAGCSQRVTPQNGSFRCPFGFLRHQEELGDNRWHNLAPCWFSHPPFGGLINAPGLQMTVGNIKSF